MISKDINRMEILRKDTFGVNPADPHRPNYHLIMQLFVGVQPVLEALPLMEKTLSFTTRLERDAVWDHLAAILFAGRPEGTAEISFTGRGVPPV